MLCRRRRSRTKLQGIFSGLSRRVVSGILGRRIQRKHTCRASKYRASPSSDSIYSGNTQGLVCAGSRVEELERGQPGSSWPDRHLKPGRRPGAGRGGPASIVDADHTGKLGYYIDEKGSSIAKFSFLSGDILELRSLPFAPRSIVVDDDRSLIYVLDKSGKRYASIRLF